MEQEKWYQSEFGKTIGRYIGYAILVAGMGIGVGQFLKLSYAPEYKYLTDKARIEIETKSRNEFQRLRTIEEIVRNLGQKMSPEELQQFLKENNLQERR